MTITSDVLLERLATKFTVGDGCWEWTASVKDTGYGQIKIDGRPRRAHRVMYELMVGPIPEGLTIDHLCSNRKCVRPDHLEPVTMGENSRRGGGLQKASALRSAMTHCKRGHEFTPENTYMQRLRTGSLARACRVCHRLKQRRWLQSRS